VQVGKPKVSYRETITGKAMNVSYKHVKQSGGRGQYGHASINVEAFDPTGMEPEDLKKLGWKDQIAFENKIFGGSVPKEFIPSIEYGVRMAAKTGVLAGLPAHQRQDHAGRRQLPPGRLVAGRLRARRQRRVQGSREEGRHHAARADHEGGRHDAARFRRQT
jgi:hypothetical protein